MWKRKSSSKHTGQNQGWITGSRPYSNTYRDYEGIGPHCNIYRNQTGEGQGQETTKRFQMRPFLNLAEGAGHMLLHTVNTQGPREQQTKKAPMTNRGRPHGSEWQGQHEPNTQGPSGQQTSTAQGTFTQKWQHVPSITEPELERKHSQANTLPPQTEPR